MSKGIKRIDDYLKHVDLPEAEPGSHRHTLRRQVLNDIERRSSMSLGNRAWRIGLAVAAVVCGGAMTTAIGMKIYRYHFQGQDAEGRYIFETGPEVIHEGVEEDPNGNTVYTSTSRSTTVAMQPEDGEEIDVEQTQADLEEIDELRDAGTRRLLRVIDCEANGDLLRVCVFEYELSDGRTMAMAEKDRSQDGPRPNLTTSQLQELRSEAKAGSGQPVDTYEETIDGQTFAFERRRFVLGDGTEVIRSEGLPKKD